ncbi:MAG: hypothetical protein PHQ40_11090, partial [Anaerolineaceae bacterium]|nr:hypothetical protein [Anaerolineaceae bacterium]
MYYWPRSAWSSDSQWYTLIVMPLITANDLGKSYGPNDIFSNLSLGIPHRARIALVGANGIGK